MQTDAVHRAAVLGAGSWGTALAVHLGSVGHDVRLWGRDRHLLDEMARRRANPTYPPAVFRKSCNR
jgi:glycerol-3-phosphate dehydrogenase (NAD(P)+)